MSITPPVSAPARRPWTGLGARPALALLLLLAACGSEHDRRLCAPPASFPDGVEYGPLVSRPSPTSIEVAWRTDASMDASVEYGLTPAYGSVATAPAARFHRVRLYGLAPDTAYHYRIVAGGAPQGGDHVLRTPPQPGTGRARFGVIGDSGTGCADELAMVAQLEKMEPDFVLHTGDVAYYHGTAEQVRNALLIPFATLAAQAPVFVTLGNHDVDTDGGRPVLDALDLPANSATGSSRFYSFDWGPVHAICLESNAPTIADPAQKAWLEADLAATKAPWKVVFFHHAAYSSSRHKSTPYVDRFWVPIFDAHHVDLVLNGHDHDYERSHPLVAGARKDAQAGPDYVNPMGTVYVVTGGGGQALYERGTSPFTVVSASVLNVVRFDVTPTTLRGTAILGDGSTYDTFTIRKGP